MIGKCPNPPLHISMLPSASCHLHAPIPILPSPCSHYHSLLLILPFPISHPNIPISTLLLALPSPCSHPHATIHTLPSQSRHFDFTVSMLPSQHTKPCDINLLLFSEARRKTYKNGEKNFKKIGRKYGLTHNHFIFTYSFSVTFFSEAGRKKHKW